MERDGNGWVECSLGHRHWGLHGAAGLLLRSTNEHGELVILLQRRAEWTHNGGTWGIPGGARDSHESPAEAALREAAEEASIDVGAVHVADVHRDDHGAWVYDTVLASTHELLATQPNEESDELEWVEVSAVSGRSLHPGFAGTWPILNARVRSLADGYSSAE